MRKTAPRGGAISEFMFSIARARSAKLCVLFHEVLKATMLHSDYKEYTILRGQKMGNFTLEDAKKKLALFGQEHALKYYDELNKDEQNAILTQIQNIDFQCILDSTKLENKKGAITPIRCLEIPEIESKKDEYTKAGIEAIKAGKVGAVLLAGGMGTRLGSDDPKGMYNIGITHDVFIFERLISNLQDVVKQCGNYITLFVMTSEKNNDATVKFFKEHNFFGYAGDKVHFFVQEMAPATDYNGKVYLEEKGRISTSPNGNGGWFLSMKKAGMLDVIHSEGIEWLNVFAVDNVLQRIADPAFVGATILGNYSVGAKVIKKAAPDEKVGVMCLEDGRPSIVEYYELTDELMNTKDSNGNPAYNFGVILNYLFKESELEEILEKKLPLHVVEKKIPYLDENGNLVKPESPNGHKYEQLVLDMILLMNTCLPYEVIREKEFAPIKNKTGIDSVESARALLEKNGVVL